MTSRKVNCFLALLGMFLLILDTDTAISGVKEGISVCLQTAVPSLLPFLIISKFLNGNILGQRIRFLSPLAKSCGVPDGLESILAIGLVGGYPVGAQAVADAYKQNVIDQKCAQRLLSFCNNAGPAFIFGISASLFQNRLLGWMIWLIQVLSALCTGILFPEKERKFHGKYCDSSCTLISALDAGVHSMVSICAWIVLFRILIAYVQKYLQIQDNVANCVLFGILELSNGCLSLNQLRSESVRFVLMNGMLAFGGICVWMQTASIAKGLKLKCFYCGKIMQTLFCILFSVIAQRFLFANGTVNTLLFSLISVIGILLISVFLYRKKVVASWRNILYNNRKKTEMRDNHAVPQEN